MITVSSYKNCTVGVVGLGLSGLATAKALRAGGARVVAWDDKPQARANAASLGLDIAPVQDALWNSLAALIPSPGIPLVAPKPHRLIVQAKARHIPIVGEVTLWQDMVRAAPCIVVAVTGTNGKSTTAMVIHKIIQSSGRPCQIGGNIGTPLLALKPPHPAGKATASASAAEKASASVLEKTADNTMVYVVELSSYQLDLSDNFAPNVAVVLNITPDHIDRHKTFAGYTNSKLRIFARCPSPYLAVVGVPSSSSGTAVESADMGAVVKKLQGRLRDALGQHVVPVCGEEFLPHGVGVCDGKLQDATSQSTITSAKESAKESTTPRRMSLPYNAALQGSHNGENIAAAFAVARWLDIPAPCIEQALKDFSGLPHRMELVDTIDGVRYVNDSKSTNASAALGALRSYDTIYWILGGLGKQGGIAMLAGTPALRHVRGAFVIGTMPELFTPTLTKAGIATTVHKTLADAVACASRQAHGDRKARQGKNAPVVLLAPAAAALDQFQNFEKRGQVFRGLVKKIARRHEASLQHKASIQGESP